METTFTPSAVWSSFDSNILSAVPGQDNGTRVPPCSWLICTVFKVMHVSVLWSNSNSSWNQQPDGTSKGTARPTSRPPGDARLLLLASPQRSVRSPERQNRANHTFQEGKSRRGETFTATFTALTSRKYVGQSWNKPVCKQAPIHSWVLTDSTLFRFLSVRGHISAALQGCGEVNQQPPKSCKLFCPFTALDPAGTVTFMSHWRPNYVWWPRQTCRSAPRLARFDLPVTAAIRLKNLG